MDPIPMEHHHTHPHHLNSHHDLNGLNGLGHEANGGHEPLQQNLDLDQEREVKTKLHTPNTMLWRPRKSKSGFYSLKVHC